VPSRRTLASGRPIRYADRCPASSSLDGNLASASCLRSVSNAGSIGPGNPTLDPDS
jgi:hypothetical protein